MNELDRFTMRESMKAGAENAAKLCDSLAADERLDRMTSREALTFAASVIRASAKGFDEAAEIALA